MNLADLREDIYRFMGLSGHNIPDHLKQEVTDNINRAQDIIYKAVPFVWWMINTETITPVTGTTTYSLDPYCIKSLGFWTAGDSAHKLRYLTARDADRIGVRNSNLSSVADGPYIVCWREPTTSADKSGAAGSTAGVSVTEGDATLTKSGGTSWASTDVGKLIYLNGESTDFTVATFTGVNEIELDRNYRGKLSGLGTTGAASNLSQARWELGPPGRKRVDIFQTQTGEDAINHRFHKRHRVLINTDEYPEAPPDWHFLIASGAKMLNSRFRSNDRDHQMMAAEYGEGISYLKKNECEDADEEAQDFYESPIVTSSYRSYLPPGTYFRH